MGDLLAALGLVFLAELGDKTQIVALSFGARYRLGPVLAGVAIGYAACNLVSVLVGGLLGAALPTRAIGIGGGLLFLAFAAWNWFGADDDFVGSEAAGPELAEGAEATGVAGAAPVGTNRATASIVASVATAMFVAELGDKTMLATATLAADGNPALVWVGATIGIFLSGAVGVLVGRSAGARLPERAIKVGSTVLFALFGVVLLATNL